MYLGPLRNIDAIQHVPVQRESVQQLLLVYLTAVRLVRVHSSAVRFGSALQSHTRGSMENTKPVGRVRPNKKAEQEESDDSINLSEEDLVSSHSEYEPDGSESDSESCLSLSTQLSSSSILSKEVENEKGNHTYLGRSLEELELDGDTLDGEKSDDECPPGEKKQTTSSRAPSPQDHLETGVEGSCGEQQSDGECLPGKKKEKRSSKASSPKDKLATCEEDSCGEEKSNRECSPVKKKQKMSSGASSQEDYLETSDKNTSAEQQSENVRSPVRKKRPSSRTQNADLVEDVETRKSDRKHTVQPRRPWTDREKEAVWRHLTKYRALKKVPVKADCLRTPVRIKNIPFQPSCQKMGESDIIAGVQSKLCSLHNLPFPFDVTKRLQGIEQKTLADILADPVEYQRVHVTVGLGRMGEGDCHHQGQQNTEQDPVHHF
ncbi:hypothetical protein SRHO_G00235970 [Serrasalmus rhombeus]